MSVNQLRCLPQPVRGESPFQGSEPRSVGCYLSGMRNRFDTLTVLFGHLILVAVTAAVVA